MFKKDRSSKLYLILYRKLSLAYKCTASNNFFCHGHHALIVGICFIQLKKLGKILLSSHLSSRLCRRAKQDSIEGGKVTSRLMNHDYHLYCGELRIVTSREALISEYSSNFINPFKASNLFIKAKCFLMQNVTI